MNRTRPPSRLPEDPAYWEGLARRSLAAALGNGTATAARPVAAWQWLAGVSYRLAAGAAIAVLMATLLRGERASPAPAPPDPLAALVAPDDRLLQAVLQAGRTAPEPLELLRLVALRAGER